MEKQKSLREQLYGTTQPLREKLAILREQNPDAVKVTKEASKPIKSKDK